MIKKVDYEEVVRVYLNGLGYFIAIENLTEESSIYSNIKKLKIKKGHIYRIDKVEKDFYKLIDISDENSCLPIAGKKLGKYVFEHYLRLITNMQEELYAYMKQSFTENHLSNLKENDFEFINLSNEEVVVKLRYMDLPLFSDYSKEYLKDMIFPILRTSAEGRGYKTQVAQQSYVRTRAIFDFNEELAALAIYHETNIEGV